MGYSFLHFLTIKCPSLNMDSMLEHNIPVLAKLATGYNFRRLLQFLSVNVVLTS